MSEKDTDVDAIIEQHKEDTRGGRQRTEAGGDDPGESGVSLRDAVADAYEEIDAGDRPENLTLRDRNLAALFAGLEASGDLVVLGEQAAVALDRDADPETRADVLRLLLRYAITDLNEGVIEGGVEGLKTYQDRQAESDF